MISTLLLSLFVGQTAPAPYEAALARAKARLVKEGISKDLLDKDEAQFRASMIRVATRESEFARTYGLEPQELPNFIVSRWLVLRLNPPERLPNLAHTMGTTGTGTTGGSTGGDDPIHKTTYTYTNPSMVTAYLKVGVLHVKSTPPGAEVQANSLRLGSTEVYFSAPVGNKVELRVEYQGKFQTRIVTIKDTRRATEAFTF